MRDVFVADDSNIDSVIAFSDRVTGEITIDGIHANSVRYVIANKGSINAKEITKAMYTDNYSDISLFDKKAEYIFD